jgi:hypothetical protein
LTHDFPRVPLALGDGTVSFRLSLLVAYNFKELSEEVIASIFSTKENGSSIFHQYVVKYIAFP